MPPVKLLYNTIRFLRPIQIIGRIWHRLYHPSVQLSSAPELRESSNVWICPVQRQPLLLRPWLFRFLNEEHELSCSMDWDTPKIEKLWRYNLHYFDDLNALDAESRNDWHKLLITRWINENQPAHGSGWEPYPTSLRIVNWIKWFLSGRELQSEWLDSLAIQAHWLEKRLEYHLLGNHLFVNAKALVFAGLFFEGPAADRWLKKGLRIIERQLPEQILEDGGQFERSTMYHALALEDVLDLCNITETYSCSISSKWSGLIEKCGLLVRDMRRWLAIMCHQDSEISFFNDAAIGIAPSPIDLDHYALDLGFEPIAIEGDGVVLLKDCGYVRIQKGPMVALLDVAPVGPDYLPGHAHADTLSFEMSLFGQRVLVNSGTSCYGSGEERLRQRGTAAHNTVLVDGQNSSEVWGGFRVARRARPFDLSLDDYNDRVFIQCSHDGYLRLPGKVIHRRVWSVSGTELAVTDTLAGEWNNAVAYYHLHPDVELEILSEEGGVLRLSGGERIYWQVESGISEIRESTYHPGFGIVLRNNIICVNITGSSCKVSFSWS